MSVALLERKLPARRPRRRRPAAGRDQPVPPGLHRADHVPVRRPGCSTGSADISGRSRPSSPGERLAWSFALFVAVRGGQPRRLRSRSWRSSSGSSSSPARRRSRAQNPLAQLAMSVPDFALLAFAAGAAAGQGRTTAATSSLYGRVVRFRMMLWRTVFRLLGTAVVLGLSLLPLSTPAARVPGPGPAGVGADRHGVRQEVVAAADADAGIRTRRRAGGAARPSWPSRSRSVTRLPLPEKGSFAVVARFFTPAPADCSSWPRRRRNARRRSPRCRRRCRSS